MCIQMLLLVHVYNIHIILYHYISLYVSIFYSIIYIYLSICIGICICICICIYIYIYMLWLLFFVCALLSYTISNIIHTCVFKASLSKLQPRRAHQHWGPRVRWRDQPRGLDENLATSPRWGNSQWPFQEPIDWRYLPSRKPIFGGYARGSTKIWAKVWYSNVPPWIGSWNYHWNSEEMGIENGGHEREFECECMGFGGFCWDHAQAIFVGVKNAYENYRYIYHQAMLRT